MWRFFVLQLLALSLFCSVCSARESRVALHPDLWIEQLSENTYLHISNLRLSEQQTFPCNGLVYVNGKEAIIMDTPVNDSLTMLLLNWITDSLGLEIKAVVVNHFHDDCLGGLAAVHAKGIPSYAYESCLTLASEAGYIAPLHGFEDTLTLRLGTQTVECHYPGAAHAPDNIVCWIPAEKLLFGGCMIKSMHAGKGNLSDADVGKWSATISKIKQIYPSAQTIVPGHGAPGGRELLDYTIQLFHP